MIANKFLANGLALVVVAAGLLADLPAVAADPPAGEVTPQFLTPEDGKQHLLGGEEDAFFAGLHPREIATMTGVDTSQLTRDQAKEVARKVFGKAVLAFTPAEEQTIRRHLERVHARLADKYPRLVRRPWRFIKTRPDLCGGFSFTRADCIVLSESTIARLARGLGQSPANTAPGEGLLLHEQLHVLQRSKPELFASLYQNVFGFRRVELQVHPWADARQVTNPDGMQEGWVAQQKGGEAALFWVGTLLLTEKPIPQMGRDFSAVAIQLKEGEKGFEMVCDKAGIPIHTDLAELRAFTSRLPVRPTFDHPNEVAAYLLTKITHGKQGASRGEAQQVLRETERWFAKHLGPEETSSDEDES